MNRRRRKRSERTEREDAERIHREMLEYLEKHPPPREKASEKRTNDPARRRKAPAPRAPTPTRPELMLRRLRFEEAMRRLRTFVEFHARRGTPEVRIVHGKGLRSGEAGPVLRDAVIRFCAEHPQWVRSHRPAPRAEGGDGALLVVLNAPR